MTEKKTRNTSELTYTAAVERLKAIDSLCCQEREEARRASDKRVTAKYRAKVLAVFARVPGKLHAALSDEAMVAPPNFNDMDMLATEGPPSEPEPDARGVMSPLEEKRLAVARGR
jgi:hypothetical protein